jgi:hypothetical protein
MAKFSDRLGFTQPLKEIQIDSMNDDLRNSLWNWVYEVLVYDGGTEGNQAIWQHYLKRPLDEVPHRQFTWVRDYCTTADWYEIYNLVEFVYNDVLRLHSRHGLDKKMAPKLNVILERELSGFRMIDSELVPISGKAEVASIRQAISEPASAGLDGPSEHIKKALSLLGKKPEPDYPNSIKESISAVESICKLLSGESGGGLDKALDKLSSQIPIHPALKKGLLSLYGYTSNESGIRHAILESKDIGFAEAKYMLVTCSAFVNFAVEKARAAKLI